MKLYFCLYPYCLVRKNGNAVIAYNAENHCYVISRDEMVVNAFEENSNCIETNVEIQSCDFFKKCVESGIGYFIESNQLPCISTPAIKIMTSIEKEKQALGYLSPSHSSQLLKEVTVFTKNTIDKGFSQLTNDIINYPNYQEFATNICDYIEKIKVFFSLNTIIISGDLDYISIENILKQVNNLSISVLIRTFADFYADVDVNDFVMSHPNVRFEFLFDKSLDISIFKAIKCNKYYNKYVFLNVLIEDKKTLNEIILSDIVDFTITPIFNDKAAIDELRDELCISVDDILNRHLSMKDILINEYINSSCYGNVVIKTNGDVVCRNQSLGNLGLFDLVYLLNKWVSNLVSCNWFYTRKRRTKCSKCIYNFLCPPISIYEEMGIIDNACVNNNRNKNELVL